MIPQRSGAVAEKQVGHGHAAHRRRPRAREKREHLSQFGLHLRDAGTTDGGPPGADRPGAPGDLHEVLPILDKFPTGGRRDEFARSSGQASIRLRGLPLGELSIQGAREQMGADAIPSSDRTGEISLWIPRFAEKEDRLAPGWLRRHQRLRQAGFLHVLMLRLQLNPRKWHD